MLLTLLNWHWPAPPPPEKRAMDGGVRRHTRRKPLHVPAKPSDQHPEDLAREQRMLEEYVRNLEKIEKKLERAPARERKKAAQVIPVPRLTDAMARAASAQQLMTIMRSVSAAELDRQHAAEEKRRRGLTAVLLLALD